MKYLNDYTRDKQTALFERCNVFFAFSQDQFDKAKKEGITYVSLGHGTFCEKSKVDEFLADLDQIQKEGIAQDIEENGLNAIIRRELNNHECYYTGDWTDATVALEQYGITDDMVRKVFRNKNAYVELVKA